MKTINYNNFIHWRPVRIRQITEWSHISKTPTEELSKELENFLEELMKEISANFNVTFGECKYNRVVLHDLKIWKYEGVLPPRNTPNPHAEENDKIIENFNNFCRNFWLEKAKKSEFINYITLEEIR